MNKKILLLIVAAVAMIVFLTGCDEATKISQSERVEMWIDDYNAGNFSSMGQHFDNSMLQYSTNVVDPSFWSSGSVFSGNYFSGYSITTNSAVSGTVRRVVITDAGTLDMNITFIEEDEDVWVITEIINNSGGSPILD